MTTERNKDLLGKSFIYPPEVIDDIHIKAELGRYRMRGFRCSRKYPAGMTLHFSLGR